MMRNARTDADSVRALQVLDDLCDGFEPRGTDAGAGGSSRGEVRVVSAADLPESYRRLLAHDRHMTATLREYFGGDLTLRVLAERSEGNVYRRCIELALTRTGAVVEVGVVRLDTDVLEPAIRAAVLERRRPLGDILNGFGVLTRVEVRWFLRWTTASGLVLSLDGRAGVPVYGRLATIHCDGRPAVDLLEVVTDDPGGAAA